MPEQQDPKSRALNLRIQQPLYDWLEQQAKAEGMTISEFSRYLLLGIKRRGER